MTAATDNFRVAIYEAETALNSIHADARRHAEAAISKTYDDDRDVVLEEVKQAKHFCRMLDTARDHVENLAKNAANMQRQIAGLLVDAHQAEAVIRASKSYVESQ